MMMIVLVLAAAAFALSFANGANDNAKGVATLIGAGRLGTRTAVRYATVATFLGSAASWVLAKGLLARFSGKGIVDAELIESPPFALAVAFGAGVTVLLATRLGLPVSTTHALVGGLGGVGLASGSLHGSALAAAFLAPLLLSPVIALGTTALLYPLFRRLRLALGVTHETCVCLTSAETVPVADGAVAASPGGPLHIVRDEIPRCSGYAGTVAGVSSQRVLDGSHLLTAGVVSFARGVNDTPKIAALLLIAAPLGLTAGPSLLLVGVAIAAGGLLASRRVAATMSHRITTMNDGQAFTANLVTALMVLFASRLGVPVSTTHVSVGALFGIGTVSGAARWKTILGIVLSWVVILPLAAILAAGVWMLAA